MNQERCFCLLLVIVDAEHRERFLDSFLMETLTRSPFFSVTRLFV